MFLVVLLVAGNETTRNAIGGGMCGLPSGFPTSGSCSGTDPEHFATMADEIARYVSPVISFVRTATE